MNTDDWRSLKALPPSLHLDPSLTALEEISKMGISPDDLVFGGGDGPTSGTPSEAGSSDGSNSVELSELLGMALDDVLAQDNQPVLHDAELDAIFASADGSAPEDTSPKLPALALGDAAEVLQTEACSTPEPTTASSPRTGAYDGIRLEVAFAKHFSLEGVDDCDSLVIKGRMVEVSAALIDERTGKRAVDAPPLQLGITIVYANGFEVEDLPNAGNEPLIEVLDVPQPWTDAQVTRAAAAVLRSGGGGGSSEAAAAVPRGGVAVGALGDGAGATAAAAGDDAQSAAATTTTDATALASPPSEGAAAASSSLARPAALKPESGSAAHATQRRKRALAFARLTAGAAAAAAPMRTVRGLATTHQGVALFRVKVNVLTSMRRGAFFRLCVFPADVALCNGAQALCAQTAAMKTLCKPPRGGVAGLPPAALAPALAPTPTQTLSTSESRGATAPPSIPPSSAPPSDAETAALAARVEEQLVTINRLRTSNSKLLEELSRVRSSLAAGGAGQGVGGKPGGESAAQSTNCVAGAEHRKRGGATRRRQ